MDSGIIILVIAVPFSTAFFGWLFSMLSNQNEKSSVTNIINLVYINDVQPCYTSHMRFPENNPQNIPPRTKEELEHLPTAANITKAREDFEAAQQKFGATGNMIDKINMLEAEMRLQQLEKASAPSKHEAGEGIEVKEYLSVEDEIAELKKKIEAAKRGAELARNLNDDGRTSQMMQKKEEFEETLAMLENSSNVVENNPAAANESDFDQATIRENLSKQRVA